MVKYTQTIRRQIAPCLSVFGHFVGLALKGLKLSDIYQVSALLSLNHSVSGFEISSKDFLTLLVHNPTVYVSSSV